MIFIVKIGRTELPPLCPSLQTYPEETAPHLSLSLAIFVFSTHSSGLFPCLIALCVNRMCAAVIFSFVFLTTRSMAPFFSICLVFFQPPCLQTQRRGSVRYDWPTNMFLSYSGNMFVVGRLSGRFKCK